METNYIKVNRIISMYYSLLDLLFLLNYWAALVEDYLVA
ncbi:hypothetical protein ACVWXS_003061 [Lysinibacillus sp. TE18511]